MFRNSFTHGSGNNDLEQLKNYEEFLNNIFIRLESIESNASHHFPHWRDAIFNFQFSQWVEAIQANNSLEQVAVDLSVGDNTLWGPRNTSNFLVAIGAIPTLDSLTLKQNNLGSPSYLVPAMTGAIECARCLTCLELQWTRVDAGAAEELNSLAKAIQRCRHLRTLSLKGGEIILSTALAFLPILKNTSLKKLCLGNVTSEAFHPFLDALCGNATLEILKVVFTGTIDDNMCEKLANALIPNNTLQSLSLILDCYRTQDCGFGEKGQQSLVRLVEKNYYLQEMTTAGSEIPTIEFFVKLNRAGRRNLFRYGSSRSNWIDVLVGVSEDVDCLFYLLLLNPSLCDV